MLRCRDKTYLSEAIAFLRQGPVQHMVELQSLERNIPAVPRRVVSALSENGSVNGVLIVISHTEKASELPLVLLRPMLRWPSWKTQPLGASSSWDLRNRVLEEIPQAASLVALSADQTAPEDLLRFRLLPDAIRASDCRFEVRQLAVADKAATDLFPAPYDGEAGHPPLSLFVEWSENQPGDQVVFGVLAHGRVLSFVNFTRCVDEIWDVGMIRTVREHRGHGLAKALLSYTSNRMIDSNKVPLYEVSASNAASIATAKAVGYEEISRQVWVVPTIGQF